jgi:hypothetical protein
MAESYATRWQPIANVITAKEWTWVDAANPSTVETQSQKVFIRSKSNTAYSSGDTSTGRLAIINFGRNISKVGTTLDFILGTIDNSGQNLDTFMTGTANGASCTFELKVKITPITAAFSTAALTWANVVTAPTLTYGAAAFTQTICQGTLSPTNLDKPTRLTIYNPAGSVLITGFYFTPTVAFYGLQVEVAPLITLNGVTLSSVSCELNTVNAGSGFKPFMLPRNGY